MLEFHIFIFCIYFQYLGKVIQYGPQGMILVMDCKGEKIDRNNVWKKEKVEIIWTSLRNRKT